MVPPRNPKLLVSVMESLDILLEMWSWKGLVALWSNSPTSEGKETVGALSLVEERPFLDYLSGGYCGL